MEEVSSSAGNAEKCVSITIKEEKVLVGIKQQKFGLDESIEDGTWHQKNHRGAKEGLGK
jgi:flagellar biogenesis protein FliO